MARPFVDAGAMSALSPAGGTFKRPGLPTGPAFGLAPAAAQALAEISR
ncbi:hypothetical protein [Candidatus Frankia alpina]|nr:hypothetical protein [Candidatus Frankia alpina]